MNWFWAWEIWSEDTMCVNSTMQQAFKLWGVRGGGRKRGTGQSPCSYNSEGPSPWTSPHPKQWPPAPWGHWAFSLLFFSQSYYSSPCTSWKSLQGKFGLFTDPTLPETGALLVLCIVLWERWAHGRYSWRKYVCRELLKAILWSRAQRSVLE